MKTAEDRGMEMATKIPMNELPHLAIAFSKYLCSQYGMCGETFITAYAVYAQVIEGLPCHDDLYKMQGWEPAWFEKNKSGTGRFVKLPSGKYTFEWDV